MVVSLKLAYDPSEMFNTAISTPVVPGAQKSIYPGDEPQNE